MRSFGLSSLPASPVALRFEAAVLVALAFSTALAGCEEPSGPRPAGGALVVAKTPEAKLDRAMERLRSALLDAQADATSGVVSQRKSDYRLIPPKEAGGQ